MRKLVVFALLAVAGAVVVRKVRSAPAPSSPTLSPAGPRERPAPVDRPQPAEDAVTPAEPPPPTTNGERVVLMSISSLEERGQEPTVEAVVGHVAAGEIHPDEGTVEALLHRLAGSGLLTAAGDDGPYRLSPSGRAALLDGSAARPSPAGGAAEELSSPTTGT